MAKFTVHVYPVVRLDFENIEAPSQEEAIRKVLDNTDLNTEVGDLEFADDIAYFLVDETGDDMYLHSTWYDQNLIPMKN